MARCGHSREWILMCCRATLCVALVCVLLVVMAGRASAATGGVQSVTYGSPGVPFGFLQPLDPAMTLGDAADERLSFVTPIVAGLPMESEAATGPLAFGRPKAEKEFLSLMWNAGADRSSTFIVSYSVDGGAWLPAVGDGGFEIPDATHGRTFAVRVWMTTSDAIASPWIDDITIEWTSWSGTPTEPEGDGSGVSHKPDSGTRKHGSGTYTYPSSTPSGGETSTSGNGSGSSSGRTTSASRTGLGGGFDGPPAGESAQIPSEAAGVPGPPVDSAGVGEAVGISGLRVDVGQQTVGVPTDLSGAAIAGTGPSSSGGADAGVSAPYALIAGGAVFLGIVLFLPWLTTAASLRQVTGFDEKRARLRGPFGPLARRR